MTVAGLPSRFREVGRLRLGTTEGKRPIRLETWRLTSPNRTPLERAAEIWGGEVTAWDAAPTDADQWQVTTDAAEIPVLVPPQDVTEGQYLELYSGGGIQRRCDGRFELLTGGGCICDAEGQERVCELTTHLSVILPSLPDVGVWRVTSHGFNAGVELPSTVNILMQVAGPGKVPAALLGIELRTRKVAGQTRHFPVPVLRLEHALEDVGAAVLSAGSSGPAMTAGDVADGGAAAASPALPAPGSEPAIDEREAGAPSPAPEPPRSGEGTKTQAIDARAVVESAESDAGRPVVAGGETSAGGPGNASGEGRPGVPAEHTHVWRDSPTMSRYLVCTVDGCLAVQRKEVPA